MMGDEKFSTSKASKTRKREWIRKAWVTYPEYYPWALIERDDSFDL